MPSEKIMCLINSSLPEVNNQLISRAQWLKLITTDNGLAQLSKTWDGFNWPTFKDFKKHLADLTRDQNRPIAGIRIKTNQDVITYAAWAFDNNCNFIVDSEFTGDCTWVSFINQADLLTD